MWPDPGPPRAETLAQIQAWLDAAGTRPADEARPGLDPAATGRAP
ncbi:MAG: hypothetical protein R3B06_25535 [Kofleriaceae bacterium]